MHYGKNDVEALRARATIQRHQRRFGRIGGEHDATAALQNVRQDLGGAFADQPVAVFGNADGHRFIFVGIEAANDGSRGNQGNFMLARTSTKQDSYAESFLAIRAHESFLFCWLGSSWFVPNLVIRANAEKGKREWRKRSGKDNWPGRRGLVE